MPEKRTPQSLVHDLLDNIEETSRLEFELAAKRLARAELLAALAPLVPEGDERRVSVGRAYDPAMLVLRTTARGSLTAELMPLVAMIDLEWPAEARSLPPEEPEPEPERRPEATCPECKGRGYVGLPDGLIGLVDCRDCDGTGKVHRPEPIPVGDASHAVPALEAASS
jgi:hypothetical protein